MFSVEHIEYTPKHISILKSLLLQNHLMDEQIFIETVKGLVSITFLIFSTGSPFLIFLIILETGLCSLSVRLVHRPYQYIICLKQKKE